MDIVDKVMIHDLDGTETAKNMYELFFTLYFRDSKDFIKLLRISCKWTHINCFLPCTSSFLATQTLVPLILHVGHRMLYHHLWAPFLNTVGLIYKGGLGFERGLTAFFPSHTGGNKEKTWECATHCSKVLGMSLLQTSCLSFDCYVGEAL
jgi:hypothetical protein